jgi:hypothetical protein
MALRGSGVQGVWRRAGKISLGIPAMPCRTVESAMARRWLATRQLPNMQITIMLHDCSLELPCAWLLGAP